MRITFCPGYIHERHAIRQLECGDGALAVLHEHDAVRPRLRAQIDASRLPSLGDVDHHEMTPRVVVGSVFTRQREPPIGADGHFVWDDRSDRHTRHLDPGAEVE